MKRKSVGGFVTGLVGILIAMPIAFYAYLVIGLILALSGNQILAYSIYSFYIAGFVGIIALCFYFTKARVGGILMLFTIILYVIPYICGIYAVSAQSGSIIALMFPLVVGNLPTLLFIISAILGLTSKAKPRIIKDANNNETPIINKSEIKYCEYCGSAISESTGICTNCNAKNIK